MLTELAGWRAMFWINLPIAVIIVAGILRHAVSGRSQTGGGMDLPGALLFTAAVMGLVLAGSQLQMPGHLTLGLLIAAAAAGLSASLISSRSNGEPRTHCCRSKPSVTARYGPV